MRRLVIIAFVCMSAFAPILATAQQIPGLKPSQTVLLYADSFDGNIDPVYGKEIIYGGFKMKESNGLTGPETINEKGILRNVSELARVDLYFPKKPNGQMVVVCPGGGYVKLSTYGEGQYVADWMLSKGITVAVVKHRMPEGHWNIPLEDVHNAFRYCRAHAQEWKIKQIGVIGFSAGGHLAACASNLYVDSVTRPDFSILIYPVISFDYNVYRSGTRPALIGKEEVWTGNEKKLSELVEYYSMEKRVSPETPQTFISHSTNDKTLVDNSLIYYKGLITHKVPVEMHIWKTGGHGWGFSSEKNVGRGNDKLAAHRKEFYTVLERWLESIR
jgi:acetyl esterase/lipase